MRTWRLIAVGLVAVVAAAPAGGSPAFAAPPDSRQMTVLPLPDGTTWSRANAINNGGVIVGYIEHRAAMWDPNGKPTILPGLPGYPESIAWGINDAGVIVGSVGTTDYAEEKAARWNLDGTVTLLAPNDDRDTAAYAINDAGDVVGWRGYTSGPKYGARFINSVAVEMPANPAFAWSQGALRDVADGGKIGSAVGTFSRWGRFGPLPSHGFELGVGPAGFDGLMLLEPAPSDNSWAVAINRDATKIAGDTLGQAALWTLENGDHPAWKLRLLGQVRPQASMSVLDMNRAGTILVGNAFINHSRISSGWVYEQGSFKELLGGIDADPVSVNNGGVIAGNSQIPSGAPRAVKWR